MTWVLIITVVSLNGSTYVGIPFNSLADCTRAGEGRVAAIYHPDAGEGADAYEVKNTFFKCERRDALKATSKPVPRGH